MGTSNLDRLIISHPVIHYHQRNSSSSSQTSDATHNNSQEDQNENLVYGGLKIQVSSSAGEFKVSNGDDDPKTPRSFEHRIPVMATCPTAPRKAKRVQVTGKRKAPFFPVVQVPADFEVYVNAMLALNKPVYVPDFVVGDLDKGNNAKKLKLLTLPAHDS